MRPPFGLARPHRQERLGPIQGLDLALLVRAQHQRLVRGVEVQPYDVPHLLDEQRILGELERLHPMRLQGKCAPDPAHGGLAQAARVGHGARAPLRRVAGPLFQRPRDHGLHLRVGDAPRGARPGFIEQAVHPPLRKPPPPPPHRLPRHADPLGHGPVGQAGRAGQHDPRALGERLCGLRAPRPALQGVALLGGQGNRIDRSSSSHWCPPFYTKYEGDDYYVS